MKTAELTGAALDWVVAKCEGQTVRIDASIPSHLILVLPGEESMVDDFYTGYSPSTNWAQGGPIIFRERIDITFMDGDEVEAWHVSGAYGHDQLPLIAAMRCYVASKLGDEVEIPKELI